VNHRRVLPLLLLAGLATAGAAPLRLGTSEALDAAVKAWGEAWAATRAGASYTLDAGKGATSAAGLTQLIEGKLDAVFTGRPLRPGEAKAYADKFGGPPLLFAVATPPPYGKENRSALGVLVHPSNPLGSLTLAQVDAIFSTARRRGGAQAITTWGQLGLGGEWAAQPVRACAVEADSGTGQYFREAVLWGGDYAAWVRPLARLSDAVVRAVAADPLAIGVTTLNFADASVRAVALSAEAGAPAYAPSDANCGSLAYPLTRQVYLCLNPATAGKHSEALVDFARFVLGPEGQAAAAKAGFAPLAAAQMAEGLARFAATPRAAGTDFRLHDLELDLKWIPPGAFDLGSPDNENSRGVDEGPLTRVNLTQGFWLGRTEVTQAQWFAIMGTNPSRFKGPVLPVEQVSWHEAMEFCRRVTAAERAAGRLPEGYAYSLPTEAQWEHAAEAGKPEGVPADVDDQAWHDNNSGGMTHPVAQKKPNARGLYDMLGNVWEWCADWYAPYPGGKAVNYAGPPDGFAKAERSASWWAGPRGQRTANRYRDMPQNGNDDLGFRLALAPAR
jgi:formylglycine-generating enzyme required for sulfatase activity